MKYPITSIYVTFYVTYLGGGGREDTKCDFQFHGSVHHISVNENTNLMRQSEVFYFT